MLQRKKQARVFLVFLFVLAFLTINPMSYAAVREPAVAGQFYPGTPNELSGYVDGLLTQTPPQKSEGEPVAFIAPHAGYPYSAPVQAYVYKSIQGKQYQTVVIIGTAHSPVSKAALIAKGSFKTPLGEVPIDEEMAAALLKQNPGLFEENESAHAREHSVEVQLPFLQRVLKDFKIVPMVIGDSGFQDLMKTGDAVADVIRERTKQGGLVLIISSTDLSHYPKRAEAVKADNEVLEAVKTLEPKALWDTDKAVMSRKIPNLHCTICGLGSVIAVMEAAKKLGADTGTILKYANSADVPFGDPNQVVGYGAVVFSASSEKGSSKTPASLYAVDQAEHIRLLKLARQTVEEFTNSGKVPELSAEDKKGKPVAIFVTLKKNGDLRGCIGSTEPLYPLEAAVKHFAYAAAVQDPRFNPVKKNELSQIDIEISILSPMAKVKSADEITPGRDGVVIEAEGRAGLFLPQVWEVLPTKEEFMSRLASEKAGLPPNVWKDPRCNLFTFQVTSFQESDFPRSKS